MSAGYAAMAANAAREAEAEAWSEALVADVAAAMADEPPASRSGTSPPGPFCNPGRAPPD
jgi:hypothetical protein